MFPIMFDVDGTVLKSYKCSNWKRVIIPDGITEIEEHAIIEAKRVDIPSSVHTISTKSFINVGKIFVDPQSLYFCVVDGVLFSKDMQRLVYYPSEKKDKEYTVPEGVKYIQTIENAYVEKINISKTVSCLFGEKVYWFCRDLKCISVSPENEYFCDADGVLFNKDKSTIIRYPTGKTESEYIVPKSVKTVETGAFDSAPLEKIVLSEGLEKLENYAIDNCRNIESITLPESMKTMSSDSVYDTSVKELFLPKQLKLEDEGAFPLSSITVDEENPYYCVIDGVLFSKDKKRLIAYPIEKRDEEFDDEDEEFIKEYFVPYGTHEIGQKAFFAAKYLETINIPDSVEEIGAYAFALCNNLEQLYIPKKFTKDYLLEKCILTEDVEIIYE